MQKNWYATRTHSKRCLSAAAEGQFHQKDNWSSRKNDKRLEDMYVISQEELGRGHFGVVHTCHSRSTGQAFACKTVLKEKLEVSVVPVFVGRTDRFAHIGKTSECFRSCSIICARNFMYAEPLITVGEQPAKCHKNCASTISVPRNLRIRFVFDSYSIRIRYDNHTIFLTSFTGLCRSLVKWLGCKRKFVPCGW